MTIPPTIGACLIVKNEEVLLGQCLDSLKGIDEIYIADTGSQDRTVELAKLYTPNVYTDFIWNDSFCDARNFIKSKAKTDWIISVDADEILHDFGAVREAVLMAEKQGSIAVDCTMVASDNGQEFTYPRLFKNVPENFWLGNIHNHLSTVGQGLSNVRITHGYSPAHQLDPDRAMRILKKEVDERGNEAVRELFYLGREYFYKNDYKNSIKTLKRYVARSQYFPEKAEAFLIMSRAYWNTKRGEQARLACSKALLINPHFKEAIVFMSVLAGKGSEDERWEKNAKQWEHMAETASNDGVLFVRKVFDFR
jgi:glycosyltransferase involved in cell wall biosynthesis